MDQKLASKDTLNIVICHESGNIANLLAENIRQGIEEEQIPSRLINGVGSSAELARVASQLSLLGVGVGLDNKGVITITNSQMPRDQIVLSVSSKGSLRTARIMGSNAARLFKKNPFIKLE